MAPFHRIVGILLSTAIISTIDASSNTVAITHRSYIGDYSNGLNVVKRHEEEEEEEYVTSFYTRVRDKRRAMFGRQLQQHDNEQSQQGANLDHSLDHYFDQLLLSSSRSKMKTEAKVTSSPVQSSSAARRVRGGAASRLTRPSLARHLHRDVAGEHGHYQAAASSANAAAASAGQGEGSKSESSSSHFERQRNHNHHSHPRARSHSSHQGRQNIHHSHRQNRSEGQDYDDGHFDAQDYNSASYDGQYDDYDDNESYHSRDADEQAADEGDDYPEHHLGLLRVPCSIAINSEEASLGHHHQHGCSSQGTLYHVQLLFYIYLIIFESNIRIIFAKT